MRIEIINPNTTKQMTAKIDRVARKYKRPETEITSVTASCGPASIENFFDEALGSVGVLEEIKRGQTRGFDGFIIACFGDPGLDAGRELSQAPVVGIGEAAMLLACTIAYRFSILSMPKRSLASLEELVRRHGLESRCASIRLLDVPVNELDANMNKVTRLLLNEARKAIEEDGAEAILLGCAGLGGLDKQLEKELRMPVIDGVVAAVKLIEALHDYGLKTSKFLTYKPPERKRVIGFPNIF